MNRPGNVSKKSITTLSSREVYRHPWLRIREDKILRSNGEEGIYGVVEKDECAVIIPIDQGRVWLVEQFRYTIQERALELPQGGWEMEVDNPEALARDELRAEIGFDAKESYNSARCGSLMASLARNSTSFSQRLEPC